MPIYIGGNEIGDIRIGSQQIASVYHGSTLVWENVVPLLYTMRYIEFSRPSGGGEWLGTGTDIEPSPGKSVQGIRITCAAGSGNCSYTIMGRNSTAESWTILGVGPAGKEYSLDLSRLPKYRYFNISNTDSGYIEWHETAGTVYYPALIFTLQYYGKKANK